MHSLTFDMLRFTERLKTAGVPQGQAVAEAEAVRDALSEALTSTVASKVELGDIRSDITEVKAEVKHVDVKLEFGLARLDAKMDSGFARLDAKIDSRLTLVDSKIDKLSWMLGGLIALNVANFCKQFI